MSSTTPKRLSVARKSANQNKWSNDRGSNSHQKNVTHRSTDSVYSVPTFSKFLIGCTLYRYMRDYWDKNGMPFLQRTLLYERGVKSDPTAPKKRISNSPIDNSRSAKRSRFSSPEPKKNSEDSNQQDFTGQKSKSVEWKPFTTKVVFDSVHDHSGVLGNAEVDVCLIRTDNKGLMVNHAMSRENGASALTATNTIMLPRNPPSANNDQTNGHVSPSITIPLISSSASLVPNLLNNAHLLDNSGSIWLLLRCKLALPRASRKGLRDSAQRRASVSLSPMKSDYCYGCLEVGDANSGFLENGCEITVFMKRLAAKLEESEKGNGRVSNGRVFNSHILKELLKEEDATMEDIGSMNMPSMKIRISQTSVQHRPHTNRQNLSPTKQQEMKSRGDHLESLCLRLPHGLAQANLDMEISSPMSSSPNTSWDNCLASLATTNGYHKNRVLYQFNFEYQQANQESGLMEACLSRVMTKLKDPKRCPFCDQRCWDLYSLMQHYRCCHARWSFVIKENADGIIVETRPTQYYDGRLETRVCRRRFSKRKICPVKKTCLDTKMLFYRPLRKRYAATGQKMMARNLDEFKTCPKDTDHDARNRAEFMLHHVRQYYHSQTCQKVLPDEFDKDSEDEMDPEWLRNRTERMIDEFTDVNEGEKSIMKMWNLHVMKYNSFGDCQMAATCETFIAKHGREIILENLVNNFILHLANLHSFGLLSQAQMFKLTKRLYSTMG